MRKYSILVLFVLLFTSCSQPLEPNIPAEAPARAYYDEVVFMRWWISCPNGDFFGDKSTSDLGGGDVAHVTPVYEAWRGVIDNKGTYGWNVTFISDSGNFHFSGENSCTSELKGTYPLYIFDHTDDFRSN